MGDGSSSRSRRVRGPKITTDRSTKRARRAKQKLDRNTSGSDGQQTGGSSSSRERRDTANSSRTGEPAARSPEEVVPEPFVTTDEIEGLERRITGWLDAGQPVHLIGPTGCGKTALALYAASNRDRPVVWLNGDEAVDTASLVGAHAGGERYEERDQFVTGVTKETEIVRERWVDNPLTIAAREGATLVYNEFSRSKPAAHNVLLSVLEEGVLERPGKRGEDRQIDVHPDFRVILTSNTAEYTGVHEQQDALLDRVVGVYVDYYSDETEREIVSSHTELPDDLIDRVVTATRALREGLDITIGTRVAITAAKGLEVFTERDETDSSMATETDDLLVDVFTDVLAPKVAERGDVTDLRNRIQEIL